MWRNFFTNTLSGWQWGLLLAIPPALIALYFLKLRREPVVVSSTYLWRRTIEDLHVNSLWQKLRQNLLLYLQLLLIGLLMLACLRPSWNSRTLVNQRTIFLLDNSASMKATDVEPTRFEAARRQIENLITQMQTGDVAMLVSFSDQARIAQRFTSDRRLLGRKLQEIKPTNRRSNIGEALRVAAGLANPGRSSEAGTGDVQTADPFPADVLIFSDGRLQGEPEFSWGNLRPRFIQFGTPTPSNAAITGFSAARNPSRQDELVILAEISNFGIEPIDVDLSLYLDDELVDASSVHVEASGPQGIEFALQVDGDCRLRAELSTTDHLALDDSAFLAVNMPRLAKVLFVTPGNEPLELGLTTGDVAKLAELFVDKPAYLASPEYAKRSEEGAFDLIIYDRCHPTVMPKANTLFIGSLPVNEGWSAGEERDTPQILDVDTAHPIMQYVALGDVTIAAGHAVEVPPGGRVLFDSDIGTLCAIAPREIFEDLTLGFEILGVDEAGEGYANTDWHIRMSFPVFFRNALSYLGGTTLEAARIQLRPGDTATLAATPEIKELKVVSPSRQEFRLQRHDKATFLFHNTAELGIYELYEGAADQPNRLLAVNLCDPSESNLVPRDVVKTAWNEVEAQPNWEMARQELWRWVLLIALVILLAEWWIYNQRVFL